MNTIWKYIFNNLWEHKGRTLVMLLSITLSATLLFVTFGIGDSYEEAQRKMAIGYAGAARIAVAAQGERKGITREEIPEISEIKHVAGILEAKGLYAKDGYYENFDLLSAVLSDWEELNAPRVQQGSLSDFTGNKIALPDRFASKYGTQVGDWISIKINGNAHEFQVAAICAYDTVFLRHRRGFHALIPIDAMSTILDSGGTYSKLLIVPEHGAAVGALQEELLDCMEAGSYTVDSVYDEASVAANARQKSMPFYLISFFTITISAFIIYSSYQVITSERLPSIGTFRSIGATETAIRNMLLVESLVYGITGSLLAFPAGYLTLKMMLSGMGESASYGIALPLRVSLFNVIISCSVAVFVSLLGAYVPVRRVSRLPVKEVILGLTKERYVPRRRMLSFGLLLFILSIVLPRIARGNLLTVAGGISLLTLIIGAILVIPLMTAVISPVLERVYGLLFGHVGRLAARNLQGSKHTDQNVVLLFISISAIIVISVVGSFVHTYIGDVFRGASLDGFSDAAVDAGFIAEVSMLDTVTEVLPLHVLDDSLQVDGQSFRVEATDNLRLYNEMLAIHYTEGDQKQIESTFDARRNLLLNEQAIRALQVRIGDQVTLHGPTGSFDYRAMGSFKSRADNVELVLPSAFAVADFGAEGYDFFVYQAAEPEVVMTQIRDMLGTQEHWSRTVEEYTDDARKTVERFLSPMNKLNYFILLLAIVGVINHFLMDYMQKRQSIAVYKSVGLSNIQRIQMTMIEGFSTGSLGALLGTTVSYLEIKTIFLVAGPKIAMTPELDLSTFVTAALMGIAITLAGSLVPIVRSAKMSVIEEIRSE